MTTSKQRKERLAKEYAFKYDCSAPIAAASFLAGFSARDEEVENLRDALDTITRMPFFSFGNGRFIQDEAQNIAGEALAKWEREYGV